MAEKFWLVWNESGRNPVYKHATEQSARAEAERLTRLHGGRFHVLSLVATCEKHDISWTSAQPSPATRRRNSPELCDLLRDNYDDEDPFADE